MTEVELTYNEESIVELEGNRELRIVVARDECGYNPREEFDYMGTMVCWHRRYDLGDVQNPPEPDDWKRDVAGELDPTVEERIDYWTDGDGWTALWNKADALWLELSCAEQRARTEVEEVQVAKVAAILALEQAKARLTLEPTEEHEEQVVYFEEYLDAKRTALVDAEYNVDELSRSKWRARQVAFDTSEARVAALVDKVLEQHTIMLPLFLYDHSGITMRTSAFSCPWDSGQVGVIYVTRAQVLEEQGITRLSPKARKWAESVLRAEVEEYDHYLTGNVHGYNWQINQVVQCDKCGRDERLPVEDDSCWGFFGDPSDYMIPENILIPLLKYGVEEVHLSY